MDLDIEVIDKVFSKDFLEKGITSIAVTTGNKKFFFQKEEYLKTVNAVISFFRNEDLPLAIRITLDSLLLQGQKFKDIDDFIRDSINPHFFLVRYAESIVLSVYSFDSIKGESQKKHSLLDDLIVDTFKLKVESLNLDLVGFSMLFSECLYSALRCGEWIRTTNSNIVTVIGGRYPNTELKSFKKSCVFNHIGFIMLDDGKILLKRLCSYISRSITKKKFIRTHCLSFNKKVVYGGNGQENMPFKEIPCLDFQGLPINEYNFISRDKQFYA
jgi:hypothetical protein